MATTGTSNEATTAISKREGTGLIGLLQKDETKAKLQEVATRHLTPEKLLRLMVGEVRRVPELGRCSIESVMRCVLDLARLGLEPSPLGLAYLVPFKGEATLIIGYRGLLELARRSGKVKRIEAHVVHAADHFVCEYGLNPKLEHVPSFTGDRGEIVAAYMVAQLEGESVQVEVMTRAEIEAVRDRSRASKSGPWQTDFSEMCRKTVVRRGAKYLPLSAEDWSRALELDREDFDDAPTKHERPAPPTLRSALGMAAPERDDGPPPVEVERDAGEEG